MASVNWTDSCRGGGVTVIPLGLALYNLRPDYPHLFKLRLRSSPQRATEGTTEDYLEARTWPSVGTGRVGQNAHQTPTWERW